MRVADVVRLGFGAYEGSHTVRAPAAEAARRMQQCRTAALGGHVQRCPKGHVERVWYNSCKHRFCPQCAFTAVERWLDKQKARLLACEHFHVVFTMPHGAYALWHCNRRVMTRLMFEQVHATLSELLEDPKYLGATVGVIAALHTWGQTLVWHPHVHCLVTGGGLTSSGAWRSVKNGYLVPVRVVRAVFARRMLEAMQAALRSGELDVPPGQRVDRWQRVLVKLGKAKWHVKVMKRYSHGEGVATYLARYLRGGPMRDRRILACDGKLVRFSYLDNRATKRSGHKGRGTMELPIDEFLHRLFQHVPEPNVHMVRHWGLYSPNRADDLARCRQQLGQPPVAPAERLDWQACCARAGGRQPHRCPVCGAQLVDGPAVAPQRHRPWKCPPSQAA